MEKLTKYQKALIKYYLLKHYEGLHMINPKQSLIKVWDIVEAEQIFKWLWKLY